MSLFLWARLLHQLVKLKAHATKAVVADYMPVRVKFDSKKVSVRVTAWLPRPYLSNFPLWSSLHPSQSLLPMFNTLHSECDDTQLHDLRDFIGSTKSWQTDENLAELVLFFFALLSIPRETRLA